MTVRCFFVQYLNAFLCGGVLCAVGQVLLDRTKLTPARILVCYVTAGVLLGGLGLYAPLVEWAGAGATVPLTGFGFTLQPVAQSHTTAQRAGLFCALSPACATLLGAAVLREHISVMGMCGIALILLSLLVPQLWQLAEKKGITLLPRHAVPAVRRA